MPIKINRAMRLADISANPGSASDMLGLIPAEVVEALTAKQLATMLDAMWAACQRSKAIAARDAIAEGAIWDAGRQQLRPIAHV